MAPAFSSGPMSRVFGPNLPFAQQAWQGGERVTAPALSVVGTGAVTNVPVQAAPYVVAQATSLGGVNSLGVNAGTGGQVNNAGDCLAVWVATTSSVNFPTGVSDPVNGAYAPAGPGQSGNAGNGQWFVMPNAQPLTAAQAITASFNGTGGSKNMHVIGCPGVVPVNPVDDTPPGNAGSGAVLPFVTSDLLSQPYELVLAGEMNANGAGAATWNSPFTIAGTSQQAASGIWTSVGYDIVGMPAVVTASATVTTGFSWAVLLISLRYALPAPAAAGASLSAAGAGAVSMPAAVGSALSVAGAGSVNAPAVSQGASMLVAGAGAVNAPLVTTGAVLSAAGLGTVSAPATLSSAAIAVAGAGSVGLLPAMILAPLSATGTGAVSVPVVTTGVTLSAAGAGLVSTSAITRAVLPVAGAGAVTAPGVVIVAPLSVAGAGTVSAIVVQAAVLAVAGAGAVSTAETITATGITGGLGAVTAAGTILAPVSIAGAGTLPALNVRILAALAAAGAGAVTAQGGGPNTVATQGTGAVSFSATVLAPLSVTGVGSMASFLIIPAAALALAGAGAVSVTATVRPSLVIVGTGQPAMTGIVAGGLVVSGAGLVTAAGVAVVVIAGLGQVNAGGTIRIPLAVTGAGLVTAMGVVTVEALLGRAVAGVMALPFDRAGVQDLGVGLAVAGVKTYGSARAAASNPAASATAGQMSTGSAKGR